MSLLIKNIRIVDSKQDFIGDVYIENGIIKEVGRNINKECTIIEGEKNLLLPSFIDLHCHFRDPGYTNKEDLLSGSRAAVKGGYTAVNLMANTNPVCDNMNVVNYVRKKVEEIGLIDVHQVVAITKNLKGEDISHLDSIDETVRFISDDGKGVQRDEIMEAAMIKAREKNIVLISHTEDNRFVKSDTRASENVMSFRDIDLAKETGCRLHLAHVSTKEAIEAVITAKNAGYNNITCEVMPHHIALDNSVEYRVNPPLREKEDINRLINAIKEGWVDAIATDHAPHTAEDKRNGAPGISGIETAFSICYTKLVEEGHITLNKLSELMSKKPAEIMGLNKGLIKEGFDGDLVIVDIDQKYKVDISKFESKGKNTPIDGMELKGSVLKTIKSGKIVYDVKMK